MKWKKNSKLAIDCLKFSPDGSLLAVKMFTRIEVYDVSTGVLRESVLASAGDSIAFARDATDLLLPPRGNHPLRRYDLAARAMKIETTVTSWRSLMAVSQNGQRIALAFDERVAIYDANTLVLERELHDPATSSVVALGFTSDDTNLLALRLDLSQSNRWDLTTGTSTLLGWQQPTGWSAVALSLDATLVAVRNAEGIHLLDANTGEVRKNLLVGFTFADPVWSSGSIVFTDNDAIRMYDTKTFNELTPANLGHTSRVGTVQFSNGMLVTRGRDATRTRDLVTGEQVAGRDVPSPAPPPGPTKPTVLLRGLHPKLERFAYSSDGNQIAAYGPSKLVALFDARSGNLRHELVGHKRDLLAVAFSPSGRILFSKDARKTFVWNVETGELLTSLNDAWPDAWSDDRREFATITHTTVVISDAAARLPPTAVALL